MKKILLCIILSSMLFTAAARNAPDLLINDACRIVTAAQPIPAEEFAATELKTYLDKVIGKTFTIVSEANNDGTPAIHLGQTALAAANSARDYGKEEYHLKVVGKNVIITGGRPRGVLFGTYEFLERFAGVRFLSINFEHIPSRNVIAVPADLDIRHAPPFIYRDIHPGRANIPDQYRRKIRQNIGGNQPQFGFSENYGSPRGCHSMHIYSADFPKEISWMNKNGYRQVVSSPNAGSICFSQPEVLDRFAAKLKDYISKDRIRYDKIGAPWPIFYVVDQNDCYVECFCPECQEKVKQHGVSGLLIDFMNKLWDRISGDYPDIYLMTFAYQDSTTPPSSGLKPKGNVTMRLAYMDHEFVESGNVKRDVMFPLSHPNNKPYNDALTAWHDCADNLAVWDYWKLYRCGFGTPIHNLSAIPGLVRRYRDIDAKHFFVGMELNPTVPLTFFDLRYYLGTKMMDNPDLDADQAIAEYMGMFYGKAAPFMQAFKAYIEKRMAEMDVPLASVKPDKRPFLDAVFFTTLNALLDQAEKAEADNQAILNNISQERLVVDHGYLYLWKNHNNPLGLDRQALQQRIAENADIFGRKYFPAIWERERESALEFLCDNMDFPEKCASIAAMPIDDLNFAGHDIIELDASELDGGCLIKDPAAFGGKARAKDSDGKPNYHAKPFTYGIYEYKFKKHLSIAALAKGNTPQDERYHWYYAGRTRVYSRQTHLWTHWSWTMSFSLRKAMQNQTHKQLYDVYISAKLQGPSYVADSQQPDEVRIDRVVLIKVNPNDPPLKQ
ncbi:MAG: DUF4838 domain-containing protein [Lentisphaerae bacterium]|nr:DUF4838 domain-containing protein [Lentisphaerota bacterium]